MCKKCISGIRSMIPPLTVYMRGNGTKTSYDSRKDSEYELYWEAEALLFGYLDPLGDHRRASGRHRERRTGERKRKRERVSE